MLYSYTKEKRKPITSNYLLVEISQSLYEKFIDMLNNFGDDHVHQFKWVNLYK